MKKIAKRYFEIVKNEPHRIKKSESKIVKIRIVMLSKILDITRQIISKNIKILEKVNNKLTN
ncbi:hypothetical protein [Mycoplasma phocimorsus]|uniref:hypothetical protein n=1 Tax=Mycoplasma phocimorsus TaxID=3045839 RepID=UPI0024BFD437|nr:hypothetical protein [Mycoplasma phocimorsus]MDJ1646657.1 hypothetical protein [Mycoplasma phocimorsus]